MFFVFFLQYKVSKQHDYQAVVGVVIVGQCRYKLTGMWSYLCTYKVILSYVIISVISINIEMKYDAVLSVLTRLCPTGLSQ